MYCSNCGKEASGNFCQNCGAALTENTGTEPMQNKIAQQEQAQDFQQKKIPLVPVIIVIAVLFIGLIIAISVAISSTQKTSSDGKELNNVGVNNVGGDNITENEPENQREEITKSGDYMVGDTVTISDWEITLNSIDVKSRVDSSFGTYFSPEVGSKYIVANLTVKNIGKNSNTFLSDIFRDDVSAKITYEDNYEFSTTELLAHPDELHNSGLNPLSSKTGIIVFEVADEAIENIDKLKLKFWTLYDDVNFILTQDSVKKSASAQSPIESSDSSDDNWPFPAGTQLVRNAEDGYKVLVRPGPGKASGTPVFEIMPNDFSTTLIYLGKYITEDDPADGFHYWYKVRVPTGGEGWVRDDLVEVVQ